MCGIHCILDKQRQLTSNDSMARMMQESAPRGPDASGIRHIEQPDHAVWCGSHRLQVSDPHPRADQPFVSTDGRYTLLYNGELYNHYELRNQLLGAGQQFATQSDTEVLLHWLIREGTFGLDALRGMFTLIFYDQQEATLWVARDRYGMKPLYYAETEAYLVLSSEAKSITASGLVKKVLHEESVSPYLCWRYPPPGKTFFRRIVSLREGQYLMSVGTQSGTIASYQPTPPADNPEPLSADGSESKLIEQVETLLTEAVLRHLATDVPTGLFLSGGVDSTLLLALLRQEGISVPTFSVAHEEVDRSYGTRDGHFARRAAEQYGAYHEAVAVSATVLEEHFEDFIRRMDQPVGDSGAFMTYLLSRTARQRVKVVLSGAGADELFGGYHRHWAYYQYLKQHAWLAKALPAARAMTWWLPTGGTPFFREQFRLLKRATNNLAVDPVETFANFISSDAFCSPNSLSEMDNPPHQLGDYGKESFVEAHLRYALRHDQQHYLITDVLAISDTMSMASGLEMRLPYLDTELQQWANRLPATLRLRHGRKWLLRRLLDQHGGKEYTQRRKEGFGLPFGGWLRNPEMPLVRRYLASHHLPVYRHVSHERVMHLWEQHRRGRQDYSQDLWAVLTLSAWLVHHFPDEN